MKTRLLIVILLTVAGGWLRFSATSFGLPDKYRPDEEYMMSRAFGFNADWNPNFAVYPAAEMYLDHFVLIAYARAAGQHGDFRSAFSANEDSLGWLVIRRVSAAFGTLTIPVTYFAAAAVFTPEASLAAAAIVAFATLHVRESHYATTDAAAVFWMTLCLAMVMRMVSSGRERYYLLAGVFAGLAAATKYPAGVVVFAIIVGHFEARRREGRSLWRSLWDFRLYLAGYATVVLFVCATPYLLLDWTQTMHDYMYQRGFVLYGLPNPLATYGMDWLFAYAAPACFGLTLMALFLAGCAWGLIRRKPGSLALVVMTALTCYSMSRSRYIFYRYLVFTIPPLAILAGGFLSDLANLLRPRIGRTAAAAILAIGVILVLAPSLMRDVELDHLLRQDDSRTVAKEWIERNLPPGSVIAVTDAGNMCGKPRLPGSYRMVQLQPIASLRAQNIHWVLSDYLPEIIFYSKGPTPIEAAELKAHAHLMVDIDPIRSGMPAPVFDPVDAYYAPLGHIYSMTRPGPDIRIWKID